jgi:hypothetical protein
MNTALISRAFPGQRVFPDLGVPEVSGAGDEEVFETKASPPAVAGPPTAATNLSVGHPGRSAAGPQ